MAFTYTGAKTKEISFPLGGIGSGCIGLAGNGRLIDWEIFNRPNKGSVNGLSHFAIKAESQGRVLDARVLHADYLGPCIGQFNTPFTGVGFGVTRPFLTGVPHFTSAEFDGAFPFATLRFIEQRFPGQVSLMAFNPFIPLNDADSSIPAAFFSVEIENITDQPLTYTICAVLANPASCDTQSAFAVDGVVKHIKLTSASIVKTDIAFGDMTVATDANDISHQNYWYRGDWFDSLQVFWKDLTTPGTFTNRVYDAPLPAPRRGVGDHCTLAAHVDLAPGERKSVRFVMSWNYPTCANYWNPPDAADAFTLGTTEACACADGSCGSVPATWKNYYATLFHDSTHSATYALENWDRLYEGTHAFKEALFSSTAPPYVLDAVSANLSTLKSPTVLRLEDGSFYGFEGCHGCEGCCEGSCTHVWNYAYALPFLFPALERSMRSLDYTYNMRFDGKMGFRLQLPLGRPFSNYHAAVDGQFGGVIKAYRDWKISGDDAWLRAHWNAIKRSIEFAWRKTNEDKWDLDKDGVLEGRQHHTLDTELFGPNAYLTGFYLAALKAAAEMATHFGEADKAQDYGALFERGRAWVDHHLFNGTYYHQDIDVTDKAILARFTDADAHYGSVEKAYWDEEHGQIKYQIAEGCHIDQVIAQWHANISGLGDIFDRIKVKSALRAIYEHNFKPSMRDVFNPCRVFAVNDEAALVICDWPRGTIKPAVPLPYAEEAQNGYEYQAAIHMIQEGLVDEGLEVVKAIRDRYDGEKRNPWNEFECGNNYARSMASYALLPALSGFEFDMVRGHIGFAPVHSPHQFRCFWSLDGAWGAYERRDGTLYVHVTAGRLTLSSYRDSLIADATGAITMRVGGEEMIRVRRDGGCLLFDEPVRITPDASLEIVIESKT
jgi:non-lysosomal glucosylceramidase